MINNNSPVSLILNITLEIENYQQMKHVLNK